MKYYTTERIKKENAYYNIIFGGRSNGKSTAVCKDLIDEFYENGNQFGRVLRYSLDMKSNEMNSWFGQQYLRDYVKNKHDKEIRFLGDRWYSIPYGEDILKCKGEDRQVMGQCFILNNEYRYKSSQYDEIKKLVIEEFSLFDVTGYIPYEFEHFLSLVSTVNRHRTDLSVWLLGNTLNKSNPYFTGLGINIDKLKIYPNQLRTMVNNYGVKYAIEYAQMSYDSMAEVPEILKISGNEIAYIGDFTTDPNVYKYDKLSAFIKSSTPVYCCTLTDGKKYWNMYKVLLTSKQHGYAIITGRMNNNSEIIIRLDNRLIDIDKRKGKTLEYLRTIGFKSYLTLYDNEEIKFKLLNALKNFT